MEHLGKSIDAVLPAALIIEHTTLSMAMDKIDSIDLAMIKKRLVIEGRSEAEVNKLEVVYRRYLALCLMFPSKDLVPTKAFDAMWHEHIIDTKAYTKDTQRVFGYYLHHNPYFGIGDQEQEERLRKAFAETSEIYERLFGEPYLLPGDGPAAGVASQCCGCCGNN